MIECTCKKWAFETKKKRGNRDLTTFDLSSSSQLTRSSTSILLNLIPFLSSLPPIDSSPFFLLVTTRILESDCNQTDDDVGNTRVCKGGKSEGCDGRQSEGNSEEQLHEMKMAITLASLLAVLRWWCANKWTNQYCLSVVDRYVIFSYKDLSSNRLKRSRKRDVA